MDKKMKLILAIMAVVVVAAIVLAGVLSSKNTDLTTQLRLAEGKLKTAENNLQSEKTAREADAAAKQGEMDAAAEEHAVALEALQAELDAEKAAHAECAAELENAKEAHAGCAAELEAEKTARAESDTALVALNEAYTALEGEMQLLDNDHQLVKAKADELATQMEALNKELADEKTAHDLTAVQLTAREAELDVVKEELALAQEELIALKEAQETVKVLLFADNEDVSITVRIYDLDDVKLHAAKVPFAAEDAAAVQQLLDENAELKIVLRIIDGSGKKAEISTVSVDRAVVEKLLAE